MIKFYLISFVILTFCQGVNAKDLSRKDLLKGIAIPERRSFPESQKVGACEDFHRYICEETEKSFKMPEDRSLWFFSFDDNSERILYAKKMFFKIVADGFNPKGPRIGQVRNFYLACMNESASKSSEQKYVDLQMSTFAQFKQVEEFQKWIGKNIDSVQFSGLEFADIPNQNNPAKNDILLLPSAMTLPEKSFYQNKALMADMKNLIELFFKSLKMDQPEIRAQRVIDFESQLAEAFPLPVEFRELTSSNTYKPKTHFLKNYPNLNLERFLNRFPEQTMIRDLAPKSMRTLNILLAKSDVLTLQSVFLYHSLSSIMDDAYPEYFQNKFSFNSKYLGGPAKRSLRDERCTKIAMDAFPFEIDEYLTPILFPNFPREKVVSLVSQVRGTVVSNLENNTWLSSGAKAEAISKMKNAPLFLVKPTKDSEWDFNPVMTYSEVDPIENSLKHKLAKKNKLIEEYKEDRKRDRWGYSPLVLNAYYSPPDNQFVLLQGILQPPFFDPSKSEIENIGAIGSVVGHELGHGIDDNGSRYDSKGQLRQWMSESDLVEFKKRGQLFVERFNAVGHNGQLTLGENIGDHVGITSAYETAFRGQKKPKKQDQQRFFKAYARMWCNVIRPEMEQVLLKTDPHSMGRERINQQVIHVPAFSEAFSCKQGDKMYVAPENQIKVW